MLKGGGGGVQICWGVEVMRKLEVLALLKGGGGWHKKVSTVQKRGEAHTVLPCLDGGGGGTKRF